jgi:hypothetical protein
MATILRNHLFLVAFCVLYTGSTLHPPPPPLAQPLLGEA